MILQSILSAFKKHDCGDYEGFCQKKQTNISQFSSLLLFLGPSQSLFKDKTAKYAVEYTYG
jgi:hypothetical protein